MKTTALPITRGLLLLCVLVLLCIPFWFSFAVAPAPVYAEDNVPTAPGSISGVVRNAAGEPVPNIAVSLYQAYYYDYWWYPVRRVVTDAEGRYRFSVLAAGLYRLEASDTTTVYARTFYTAANHILEAADVLVSGNQRTDVDFTLSQAGQITGTVSFPTGITLTYQTVELYQKLDQPLSPDQPWGGWQQIDTRVPTGDHLEFLFTGLVADSYRVCATGYSSNNNYWRECYDNVYDLNVATNLTVTAGATISNVAIVLGDNADYATISGRLTSPQNEPLAGVSVYIIPANSSSWYPFAATPDSAMTGLMGAAGLTTSPFEPYIDLTTTDNNGDYQLDNLAAGAYHLLFQDQLGRYRYAYYDNVIFRSNATTVQVAKREVITGINAQLGMGAHINGVITLLGQPAPSTNITLFRRQGANWRAVAGTASDPITGRYDLGGLPAGVYRLQASAWINGTTYQYQYQTFYGSTNFEAATNIVLTDAGTQADININLDNGPKFNGVITGRVTADGTPRANVKVSLYSSNYTYYDSLTAGPVQAYAITDQTGRYQIEGLTSGFYFVRYDDQSGQRASLFYPDKLRPTLENVVETSDDGVVADIDIALPQAGSVKGRVYLRDGTAVPNVTMLAVMTADQQGPFIFREVKTANDGSYQLQGLHPGTYHICASGSYPNNYSGLECYGSVEPYQWFTSGRAITVEAGATIDTIDLLWGPEHKQYLPVVAR